MQLRRFNDKGEKAFIEYLDALRTDARRPVPTDLLDKPTLTEPLEPAIEAEPPADGFATRMDFACWLHDAATAADAEVPRKDVGFWSWLTLVLFDSVCPANAKGERKVKELAWYIPAFDDARRHYRQALSGSYTVHQLHQDDPSRVAIFLRRPPDSLGHFWYQLASRQDLMSNPSVVSAATRLYYDPVKHKLKPGAVVRNKPGSVFRFVKVLNQLDRVWDLRLRSAKGVIDLLPQKEFAAFQAD
ncbi:MAG: hypothetical protein AAF288_00525 [Planctomycetota bacterium]